MGKVKKVFIGIDIGGTKTHIGLINEEGLFLGSAKIATRPIGESAEKSVKNIIKNVKNLIHVYRVEAKLYSIGIGVPGTVDRGKGELIYAPNLEWRNIPLKQIFQEYFQKPVYIGQDTEAAVLGEFLFGAGKGFKDIVCITIGTGIGCGIIINGQIYKGQFGTAGELGHTIVKKGGLLCNCGKNGCMEAYASGTAMLKRFKSAVKDEKSSSLLQRVGLESITTEDIFFEAKAGDLLSRQIIDEAVDYLSISVINLINILSPQAVIFSGGISSEKELFIAPLIKRVNNGIYSLLNGKIKMSIAKFGCNAPTIGAAMFFRDPLYYS